jgi:hypothetical protein
MKNLAKNDPNYWLIAKPIYTNTNIQQHSTPIKLYYQASRLKLL